MSHGFSSYENFTDEVPTVGFEACKGFPSTSIRGTDTMAGSAFYKKASPPLKPHDRIYNVHFLYPLEQPGLRGHPLKVRGPSWRLLIKTSFSVRFVTFWNRLPTFIAPPLPSTHSSAISIQHGMLCFQRSCD